MVRDITRAALAGQATGSGDELSTQQDLADGCRK
jgi:hypothetical protein